MPSSLLENKTIKLTVNRVLTIDRVPYSGNALYYQTPQGEAFIKTRVFCRGML